MTTSNSNPVTDMKGAGHDSRNQGNKKWYVIYEEEWSGISDRNGEFTSRIAKHFFLSGDAELREHLISKHKSITEFNFSDDYIFGYHGNYTLEVCCLEWDGTERKINLREIIS